MYQLIVSWLRPYSLAHLVLLLAMVWLWRSSKERGRPLWVATLAWLSILLLSLNPVTCLLLGTLEWDFPPRETWPADAQAIVVLSGDYLLADDLRRKAELGPATLSRCLHAVEVHAATRLPIIVSGGEFHMEVRDPGCAAIMRTFLVQNGVPDDDIVVENNSTSTHENAVNSARLLRERGWSRIILVTDAMHMPRALSCFQKQQVAATPSACTHRATQLPGTVNGWIVPNPLSVYNAQSAFHEWMGRLWYWLRGYT